MFQSWTVWMAVNWEIGEFLTGTRLYGKYLSRIYRGASGNESELLGAHLNPVADHEVVHMCASPVDCAQTLLLIGSKLVQRQRQAPVHPPQVTVMLWIFAKSQWTPQAWQHSYQSCPAGSPSALPATFASVSSAHVKTPQPNFNVLLSMLFYARD